MAYYASRYKQPDFLTTPHDIQESFHCRVGKPPQAQASGPKSDAPANAFGFPIPGPQNPSATSVMAQDYFVSNSTWNNILDHGEFDYIVVGSGCTALAFIDQVLRLNPKKRILCLERGDFWLPSHFQNLPLPFKMVLGGPSETYPWTLSTATFKDKRIKYCHGSCPFFGGRSTFWSAWSPQPQIDLMRNFPPEMIKATKDSSFWPKAKELLNVTSAAEIDDTIFAGLQKYIDGRLEVPLRAVPSASFSEPAQLSVGRRSPTSTLRFNKFSVPGPLLGILESQRQKAQETTGAPLEIMLNCAVRGLQSEDDGTVRAIDTSQGTVAWSNDNTKVILCAGAIPNATLLLNSFSNAKDTVGKRLTGHFLSHVAARVPISNLGKWPSPTNKLEIAAHYLSGKLSTTQMQYHVQITAIHSPNPKQDAVDVARECPDYAAAATYEQLSGSEDYVVFVCATLGEFTEKGTTSWIHPDPKNKDPTSNIILQYTLTHDDTVLWDLMDTATYQTIEAMAGGTDGIQYWHETNKGWKNDKPEVQDIRVPGVVHEASTAFVGASNEGGSLDNLYRPHGVKNVFVTGGAIFPTAGSWNPTLTMCGFAQDLARRLEAGEGKYVTTDKTDT